MIHCTYWRSMAAYRVRIALNLKGAAHESAYVHLSRDGGEHKQAADRAKNPQGLVPALEVKAKHLCCSAHKSGRRSWLLVRKFAKSRKVSHQMRRIIFQ